MSIDDNLWNIEGLSQPRVRSYLNVGAQDEYVATAPHVLKRFNFDVGNQSVRYERQVKSYIQALGEVGGLLDILVLSLMIVHWLLIKPFETIQMLRNF